MAIKRAKPLNKEQYERLEAFALQRSRMPASDRMKLRLSFHAGLRACEIARIRVTDMTDPSGNPNRYITIFGSITKRGRTRVVPMHDAIREALIEFRKAHPTARYIALSSRKKFGRPKAMTPGAISQWFWHLYRDAGFPNCSSHSGRRSFGTRLAILAPKHGRTIVDVQQLLGHARLDTTAAYIEPNENVTALVNAI